MHTQKKVLKNNGAKHPSKTATPLEWTLLKVKWVKSPIKYSED
jgi:hypothetical protein